MSVAELEAEILAASTAIGLVRDGELQVGFFADPLTHVQTMLKDGQQRAAVLQALDGLLPPATGSAVTVGDESVTRHPIVAEPGGSVALSIGRSGPTDAPTVTVGLWAGAADAASGCAVEVDLPLVQGPGQADAIAVVAGTPAYPLAVSAVVPIGWERADHPIGLQRVELSALVVLPPHLDASRISIRLVGLDLGTGPADLVLDPADLENDLSHVVTSLVFAGLRQAAAGAGALLTLLIDHLPGVLGLDDLLPPLPIAALLSDPGAFPGWIGSLLSAQLDGRPALLHWLDQIGQLLGAPALASTLTQIPGPDDPVVIPIVSGAGVLLTVEAFVQTPTSSTTPELHLGLTAALPGDLAAVKAEAELLVVPLGGTAAARPLTSAQIVVESAGPIWPRSGQTDSDLRVGVVRGGLRWDGNAVVPVLELDGVHVELSGVVQTPTDFARLDFTNAKTLASAASQTVGAFLTDHLGTDPLATAVLTLIGLGTSPSAEELGAFANDPLRAIGAFHRTGLAGDYRPIAQQIVALFGVTATVSGNGTAADPWLAPLAGIALPDATPLSVGLAIWDAPQSTDHELCIGLRLGTPAAVARPSWSIALNADLISFALPARGAARPGFLGGIRVDLQLRLPQATGATVIADALTGTLDWTPGGALQTTLAITGVSVTIDGTAVDVGDIAVPDGLSVSTLTSAWPAVRRLLGRAAADWAGPSGAWLATLLGLAPALGPLPDGWPALDLPAGGLSGLLADPLAVLKARLATLVSAGPGADGRIPLLHALDLLGGLLGQELPTVPGAGGADVPAGLGLSGSGRYDDPWALPLSDTQTPLAGAAVDLVAWLEPGPPADWAAAGLALLGADGIDLPAAMSALTPWIATLGEAATGLTTDGSSSWLSAVATAVDGTDGWVASDLDDVLPTGVVAADPVTAAHLRLPQAAGAVAAATAHLAAHAAGLPVLLLAPSFAPNDVWSAQLSGVATDQQAQVTLRAPGVDPSLVDLGGMTAASHYIVDLADDGTPALADLVARLHRVVTQVTSVTGAAKVALIGHSTAGLAAAAYVVAHPLVCAAAVTLAAPFIPVDPASTFSAEVAGGIRLLRTLAPAGLASVAPALDAALTDLAAGLDGRAAAPLGGDPTALPGGFPSLAFTRTMPPGVDLSAVPTLAVPAQLDLPVALACSAALANATAGAGAPTHLAWGLRARAELAADTGPQLAVCARFDLGRVALTSGAVDPAHPAHRLRIEALVSDPSGWLVGGAGNGTPPDVRLRAARFTLDHAFGVPAGTATVADVTFYDAAVRGVGTPVSALADTVSAELLRGLVQTLAAAAGDPQAPAYRVLASLSSLGLLSFDPVDKTASIYADAVTALRTDPAGWFAARLPALLEASPELLGLTEDQAPDAAVPRSWHRSLGNLPIELAVGTSPWSVGLRCTGDGLDLSGAHVSGAVTMALSGPSVGLDLQATIGVAGITVSYDRSAGTVTVAAPPVLPVVTVLPLAATNAAPAALPAATNTAAMNTAAMNTAATNTVEQALLTAIGRTGLYAAISAALSDALGGVLPLGSLAGLIDDPVGWFRAAERFGDGADGFHASAVQRLLGALAPALQLTIDGTGAVQIAPGLTLAATAPATGQLELALTATALALTSGAGPTLTAALGLTLATGAGGGVATTPAGSIGVTVPLGGTWPSLAVTAGSSPDGLALAIDPGTGPVELLPHFAGLWDLLGGGLTALLPGVLNGLVERIDGAGGSQVFDSALAVADALGLRPGTPPAFDSTVLAGLVNAITAGTLVPTPQTLANVVTSLLPTGSPVTVSATGSALTVDLTSLPVAGELHLTAQLPGGSGPTVGVTLQGVALGPVLADMTLADQGGVLGVDVTVGVQLGGADLGFDFAPALRLSAGAGPLTVALLPLGTADPLTITLAPTPGIAPDRDHLAGLLVAWAEPILARIALDEVAALLTRPLFSAGPTAAQLLTDAGLVHDIGGGTLRPIHPLPDPTTLLRGLLAALQAFTIPVTQDISIGVIAENTTWLGLAATGHIDLPIGDFTLTVLLGPGPDNPWPDQSAGLGVLLVDDSAGIVAKPALRLGGVGLKLTRTSGALVDTAEIRIGDIAALLLTELDFDGGVQVRTIHGGVQLSQVGLPLGGSGESGNPVASSLLSSSGSGDNQPADPPSDLTVFSTDTGLQVQINGKDASQPFYVDVQKTFGPLHIDRIGLLHRGPSGADTVGALVDGGVSIAGLTVDVQGLELDIPLKHPAELDQWHIDLAGLAVSFVSGPVSIAGGLLKTTTNGVVEYDGMLSVQVESFGLTALGAYSKPDDSSGDPYTSLFVFVVVDAPIGGPPYLFITGLAGGAGYNRQLVVPSDPSLIPTFPLIKVMGTGVGPNPMDTLHQMSAAMPARRGSYWVAAGVTFSTFELLHTRAMAYVALDRGFEVGLLGLMTMALPTADTAVVSIELALSARYSSVEQLLAIRAQLTNNSWLISRDCQLTGGFAFYAWFGDHPQVILTIGGYGPYWQVSAGDPHAYPVVPPVGFHWAVGAGIVVKGETYFAMTPHQLAFGGRLEAGYDNDPIRVWFIAYLDVELQWDPLHYAMDIGVSIGAAFHFSIDLLFGSITINVSISLGAALLIQGPPLHGTVTVDLEIASVTVHFGTLAAPPALGWPAFVAKYAGLSAPTVTSAGAVDRGSGTSVATVGYGQMSDGQRRDDQPNGSESAPWRVLPEFGLSVVSKTPVLSGSFAGTSVASTSFTGIFELAPTGSTGFGFQSRLAVVVETWDSTAHTATGVVAVDVDVAEIAGHFPLAVWALTHPPDDNTDPIPTSPTMTTAMSGVTLAFPVTLAPPGVRPTIPVSTLVEEGHPVLGLPFATAAVPAPTGVLRPSVGPTAEPVIGLPRSLPRRHAILPAGPAVRAAVRTHRSGLIAAPGSPGDGSGGQDTMLTAGEVHVWRPNGPAHFRATSAGALRLTSLSVTGRVLSDVVGALDVDLPAQTGTAVTSAVVDARAPAGWALGSPLHQVGAATALGERCTVLLPRPVRAPLPGPVERTIAAHRLLAGLPGVRTLLPSGISVVIVVVDRLDPSAPDDLVIAGPGLGEPRVLRAGSRQVRCYQVAEATPDEPIGVDVVSTAAWTVSGVFGAFEPAADWADLLAADPYRQVLDARSTPGSASQTTEGSTGALYRWEMSK